MGNKTGKIVILGLDNAGKTTLLGRFATDQAPPNNEELDLGGIKLKTIDVGGHVEARRLWKDCFTKVDGVVFIFDAANLARFDEAKHELDVLLQTEELLKTPFVILANKIDLPQTPSENDLKNAMGISGLTTGKTAKVSKESGVRPLEVFPCSVIKRVGYGDAARWLSQYLHNASPLSWLTSTKDK